MSGEHPRGRQALEAMTDRLVQHEQRLRRQAQESGSDRPPRSADDLRRTATNTALRYDSGRGARRR